MGNAMNDKLRMNTTYTIQEEQESLNENIFDMQVMDSSAIREIVKLTTAPPIPSMPWVLRDGTVNCDLLVQALIKRNPALAVVTNVSERLFATMSDTGGYENLAAAEIDYLIRPLVPSGKLTRLLLKEIKAILAASCPIRIGRGEQHKSALHSFITLYCERGNPHHYRVHRSDFRRRYWQWCDDNKLPRLKIQEVFQNMEALGHTVKLGDGGRHCFAGLRWKS
jgi:hypothetical protein